MKPISLLICALGGEGGGVLTQWLVEIARQAGFAAQSTSIPGVAQRTGATTYYLEVFPLAIALLQGRQPVFSLNPVPGALDAMVSSELLETTRQIGNGMSTPDRTLVITSSSRIFTTQERMQLGDGRADSADLLKVVAAFSREHHVFDMAGDGAAGRHRGQRRHARRDRRQRPVSVCPRTLRERGARRRRHVGRSQPARLRAGVRDRAARRPLTAGAAARGCGCGGTERHRTAPATAAPLPPTVAAEFPAAVHDMLALGHARMLEYQDTAYGELYLQRLRAVLQAERDGRSAGRGTVSPPHARWRAGWRCGWRSTTSCGWPTSRAGPAAGSA